MSTSQSSALSRKPVHDMGWDSTSMQERISPQWHRPIHSNRSRFPIHQSLLILSRDIHSPGNPDPGGNQGASTMLAINKPNKHNTQWNL